jgi:hypothetical protein
MDEVVNLRLDVRLWFAISGSSASRWFGGSEHLKAITLSGQLSAILMRIRRLTAPPKESRKKLADDVSLVTFVQRHIEDSNGPEKALWETRKPIADGLRGNRNIKHLCTIADKAIAHANPIGLSQSSAYSETVGAEYYTPQIICEATKLISDLYLEWVEPTMISADPGSLGSDPFLLRLRTKGLPVLDFEPEAVFQSPEIEPSVDDRFVVCGEDDWEDIITHLPRPLPESAVKVDVYRWRYLPADKKDYTALAARWGWRGCGVRDGQLAPSGRG